jgi:hypothetical protein
MSKAAIYKAKTTIRPVHFRDLARMCWPEGVWEGNRRTDLSTLDRNALSPDLPGSEK